MHPPHHDECTNVITTLIKWTNLNLIMFLLVKFQMNLSSNTFVTIRILPCFFCILDKFWLHLPMKSNNLHIVILPTFFIFFISICFTFFNLQHFFFGCNFFFEIVFSFWLQMVSQLGHSSLGCLENCELLH